MISRRIESLLLSGCNWYDIMISFDLCEIAADTGHIDASGWKPSC